MKSTTRTLGLLIGLTLSLALPASAQLGNGGARIMLGGGYLEEPGTGYFVGSLGWTVYEDAAFAHTFFGEVLVHSDDSRLDFPGPGGAILFTEPADLVFSNITLNYEFEAKLNSIFSFYAGAGAGGEFISINDRFEIALDEDLNFVSQAFAGIRVNLGESLEANIGIRHVFREDFELLNDQFIVEDSFGFEVSIGFDW